MKSRKQKITNFLRGHRLALWVVTAICIYTALSYLKLEIAGKGLELLGYPTMEVLLERFLND
jgi:hypothetical protein